MTEAQAPYSARSGDVTIRRTQTPDDGRGAVKISTRPAALVGVRIPSRNQHTRDLVCRLYEENLYLRRADLLSVTRYAELCWKFRRLAELQERMGDTSGYLKQDLEPRKILAELRSLADSLLRHEAALALVPSARASLGVNIGKLRSRDGGGAMPEEDIASLEQRIVQRLSEGHQTPQDGRDAAEGGEGE